MPQEAANDGRDQNPMIMMGTRLLAPFRIQIGEKQLTTPIPPRGIAERIARIRHARNPLAMHVPS